MQELVNVEGTRWRIEECFETAKNEFGLDHNETRSWHGWHTPIKVALHDTQLGMGGVRQKMMQRRKLQSKPERKGRSGQ